MPDEGHESGRNTCVSSARDLCSAVALRYLEIVLLNGDNFW